MNPFDIIKKYYNPDGEAYKILVHHSSDVANKAISFAKNRPDLNLDLRFIEEAAMLHDIGVCKTFAPDIYCEGENAYLCHGYLGCEMMMKEGYPLHALVCERHIGTGLTRDYIIRANLPLPHREMTPVSIEEQIICFADKFYSKSHLGKELTIEAVRAQLVKYGREDVVRFDNWCEMFIR
ncbi:HDIG domain-containing protein [Dysgonomonas sp. 521]|uniref:HDIG domain-containing metalloprotein n=1 Tax=Dysgonomonas sp. 521 TaxID=2302932 RepID=UPI0013D89D3B|nr:HDIG domain-containing metalloprotein [Dysgonomonas sp. 521]NDV96423.1 HDIG domain-containing protein [Dysgonomonas sp. 521]